jgi:hypothetical protein
MLTFDVSWIRHGSFEKPPHGCRSQCAGRGHAHTMEETSTATAVLLLRVPSVTTNWGPGVVHTMDAVAGGS